MKAFTALKLSAGSMGIIPINPLRCDFCDIRPAEYSLPQSSNLGEFPSGVARICYVCKHQLETFAASHHVKFYATFDTGSVPTNMKISSLGNVPREGEPGYKEKVKGGIRERLGSKKTYEVDIETVLKVNALFD